MSIMKKWPLVILSDIFKLEGIHQIHVQENLQEDYSKMQDAYEGPLFADKDSKLASPNFPTYFWTRKYEVKSDSG